jgi:hypothetical protein
MRVFVCVCVRARARVCTPQCLHSTVVHTLLPGPVAQIEDQPSGYFMYIPITTPTFLALNLKFRS